MGQVMSGISTMYRLTVIRAKLQLLYVATGIKLATVWGQGQVMQAAVTNKSLSDRGLHRGHLLVSVNRNTVQSRCTCLAGGLCYGDWGEGKIPFFHWPHPTAQHRSSLHPISEFGGEKRRHNCILSSLTQKSPSSLQLTFACRVCKLLFRC